MSTTAEDRDFETGGPFNPTCPVPTTPTVPPPGWATVALPAHTFTGLLPGHPYEVTFTWNGPNEGVFSPFPVADFVACNPACQFNRNSAKTGQSQIAWTVTMPNTGGGPYATASLAITAASLLGTWSKPDHTTIAGEWTIRAL